MTGAFGIFTLCVYVAGMTLVLVLIARWGERRYYAREVALREARNHNILACTICPHCSFCEQCYQANGKHVCQGE